MTNEKNIDMNKPTVIPEIDEISILKSTIRSLESLVPIVTDDTRNLIPRNQNKMIAEKTKDMYFGGLMSE